MNRLDSVYALMMIFGMTVTIMTIVHPAIIVSTASVFRPSVLVNIVHKQQQTANPMKTNLTTAFVVSIIVIQIVMVVVAANVPAIFVVIAAVKNARNVAITEEVNVTPIVLANATNGLQITDLLEVCRIRRAEILFLKQ